MIAPKTLADLRSLGGKAAQAKRSPEDRRRIGMEAAAKRWAGHVKVPRDRRRVKPAPSDPAQ